MDKILNSNSKLLGECLVERGLITDEQLDMALREQERLSNTPLGRILSNHGFIRPLDLYREIAAAKNLPFVDIKESPADGGLCVYSDFSSYMRYSYIPYAVDEENNKLIIACSDFSDELKRFVEGHYSQFEYIEYVMTSPRDLLWAIESALHEELNKSARDSLYKAKPLRSARYRIFAPASKLAALMICVSLFVMYPSTILLGLIILVDLFYIGTLLFKSFLFVSSYFFREGTLNCVKLDYEAKSLKDSALPIYTILVPLYKEAKSVNRLLNALRVIDYPKSKLDVKLIVEEDDIETINAIKKYRPEAMFDIIKVPFSLPRTKPKACNYALKFAQGKYVCIYDAEDSPEPLQLRKAVVTFNKYKGDKLLTCLQARLNYYNRQSNLLTRLFSIEYAFLFDFINPALAKFGIPIPLSGTSNHIVRANLEKLYGWDPYNVTEDADIGLRMAMENMLTLPLDSETKEEAPIYLRVWLKQRTRWIKGYLQTWMVYMRRPSELCNKFGAWRFMGLQMFMGGSSIVYMFAPFLWLISILYVMGLTDGWLFMPEILFELSLNILIFGIVIQWITALLIVRSRRWLGMKDAVLCFPFYWFLHMLASFYALSELIYKPYHWNKTPHALDNNDNNSEA